MRRMHALQQLACSSMRAGPALSYSSLVECMPALTLGLSRRRRSMRYGVRRDGVINRTARSSC
jgi:hypothetical protein